MGVWGWRKGSKKLQKPERALCPLVLELQAVISHLTWMLGTTLRSSGRNPASLCILSPAPDLCLLFSETVLICILVICSTGITDEQPHSPWKSLFPSTTQAIDCYMLPKIENLVGDLAQW